MRTASAGSVARHRPGGGRRAAGHAAHGLRWIACGGRPTCCRTTRMSARPPAHVPAGHRGHASLVGHVLWHGARLGRSDRELVRPGVCEAFATIQLTSTTIDFRNVDDGEVDDVATAVVPAGTYSWGSSASRTSAAERRRTEPEWAAAPASVQRSGLRRPARPVRQGGHRGRRGGRPSASTATETRAWSTPRRRNALQSAARSATAA